MKEYKKWVEIDYSKFETDEKQILDTDILYGLPRDILFCKKCVLSNQRPNSCREFKYKIGGKKETIHFDVNGVCDACNNFSNKIRNVDWDDREKELIELCNRYRKNDGSYDCLVPGSGGKDSFYVSHILKYKYGMHPLTVTWSPHIYTTWGFENFEAWVHTGFDNYLCSPNGRIHRLLTRLALENLYHPFQPFILGQKQLAPKMAKLFGIKLVFFGEHEAEYGNPIKENQRRTRDKKYYTVENKKDVLLAGISVGELVEEYGIDMADLEIYLPQTEEEIDSTDMEVHYMGYYKNWHPQDMYYYAMEHGGFKPAPERSAGSYSKYSGIDDRIDDLHFYTTYIKFGIGRATYDAAQEIRNGELTREEAIALVKKYDGEYPERFEKENFEYLTMDEKHFPRESKFFEQPIMTREYFDNLTDRFRSPHLWKYENGIWKLRHTVFDV